MADWTRTGYGFIAALVLLLAGLAGGAKAAVVDARVTYVSSSSVYLDSGSEAGIAQGDSVRLVREGMILARLEVTYVAASTAACRILEGEGAVQQGDVVQVYIERTPMEAEADSTAVQPAYQPPPEVVDQPGVIEPETTVREFRPRLTGHIGVQLMLQNDLERTNYDVTEPSLVARLRGENILGPWTTLSIRFRTRRVQRPASLSPDTPSEWQNRIYEVALSYDNPEGPYAFQAGRIISNRFAGIGTLDGALGERRLTEEIAVGAFAGTQPDPATSGVGLQESKAGLYAAWEHGSWQTMRSAATLALAGRYNNGSISQEFLYEQLQFSLGEKMSLYQSGELNINRGWRKTVSGNTLDLGNLLVNARWQAMQMVAFDVGYDNRTQVRTWETRDVPDSLFDTALRQGFRAGVNVRTPWKMNLYARAGLRTRQGDTRDTRTFSGGLTQRDLFGSGLVATAQVNMFRNLFSFGYQPSLGLSRYFFRLLYLNLQLGQSRYDLVNGGGTVAYTWLRAGATANVTRAIYTAVNLEAYRGDNLSSNRIYLEAGYRF